MTTSIAPGHVASCLRCARIVLVTEKGLLNPPPRLHDAIGRAVGFEYRLTQGLGYIRGWHECNPKEYVGLRYMDLMPLKGGS